MASFTDDDDDERKLARLGLSRASATRRASPTAPEPLPGLLQPVDLANVDAANARSLLSSAARIAESIIKGADGYQLTQMAGTAIDMTLSGLAADGVTRKSFVAQSAVGQGHLKERFGQVWQDTCAAASHAIYAIAGQRTFYHEIRSISLPAGRRHHGLGVDQVYGRSRRLHLLVRSLAGGDRHCPVSARPLATATCWDRTSERFDPDEPLRFPDVDYPHTLSEAIGVSISDHLRLRNRMQRFFGDRPEAFSEVLRQALSQTMPDLFVIQGIDCGPPQDRVRQSATKLWPGRDEDVVRVLRESGVRGLLACGGPQADERDLAGFVEQRLGFTPAILQQLGITEAFGIAHYYDAERGLVARMSANLGVRTEVWRVVGFDRPQELRWALALIERQAQCNWMGACIRRWAADSGPGALKSRVPTICAGLTDALTVANTAIVAAERHARAARPMPATRQA